MKLFYDDLSMSEFMLEVLRCGNLRARLMANELDVVRVALKNKMMSAEDAIRAIDDLSAWFLIPEQLAKEGA
jgi:hypothetical protein